MVLKDVFDLSLDEVAEALSTSVGTVKTTLHRGRSKLTTLEQARPCAASLVSSLTATR